MRHTVALMADTACDVPAAMVEQYDITMVDLYLIWGAEQYLTSEIDLDWFYKRLASDPIYPKSSMPTVQDFIDKIEEARRNGAEEVVIITTSRRMSATIESAEKAREQVAIPIYTVDSKSSSMGLGWQVVAAARAREAGGGVREMVAAADSVRQNLQFIFAVDSLDALHKGGRIGGAARWFGTAIQLKPQLYFDHEIGMIMPGAKIRTRKKSLEHMYQVFFKKMDTNKPMHLAVMHANVLDEAQAIAEQIRAEYSPAELLIEDVSIVVSTHCGEGSLGIAGYYED
jgi:DegV family protein with EDD domain